MGVCCWEEKGESKSRQHRIVQGAKGKQGGEVSNGTEIADNVGENTRRVKSRIIDGNEDRGFEEQIILLMVLTAYSVGRGRSRIKPSTQQLSSSSGLVA